MAQTSAIPCLSSRTTRTTWTLIRRTQTWTHLLIKTLSSTTQKWGSKHNPWTIKWTTANKTPHKQTLTFPTKPRVKSLRRSRSLLSSTWMMKRKTQLWATLRTATRKIRAITNSRRTCKLLIKSHSTQIDLLETLRRVTRTMTMTTTQAALIRAKRVSRALRLIS